MSGKEVLIPYETRVSQLAKQVRDMPHAAAPLLALFFGIYCLDLCWRLFVLGNIINWSVPTPILQPIASFFGIPCTAVSNILFGFIILLFWWYPFILQATKPLRTGAWLGITEDRLHLPASSLLSARFRCHRDWSDISYVTANKKSELLLSFQSGGCAKISLANIPAAQRELVLLTVDTKCDGKRKDSSIEALLSEMHDKRLELGELSATQIWEDEFNRKFRPTSFVPLEPKTRLRDDTVTVLKLLAFGGFSAVYLAQRHNGELVVLKESVMPNAGAEAQSKAREMLEREAALLMKVSHPQVVRVLDHFVANGRDYLMLEYLRGENLRSLVQRSGAQDEKTVLNWAQQIAEILQALHDQDPPIIHRDVTPDNLILHDGKIVLIDFGAANECIGNATGTLIGKQSYIPPEQFRGKATVASDLYALGGTMHYLLTAKEPEPLQQSHPSMVLPTVRAETDALVAKLTEQNQDDRFRSGNDLIARIQAVADKLEQVEVCAS